MSRGLFLNLIHAISAMNVKYSFFKCAVAATGVCAALLSGIACTDDFGYQNLEGKQIAFNIIAPNTWHDGMDINENAPTTHCTSVKEMAGDGGTKLYLHTVVADNPVEETVSATRGTPISDLTMFKDKYKRFSLSGICYTGTYPEDESQNKLTAEYAYDLPYSTASGTPAEGGRPLLWPSNGKVRFFAFAPTVTDFANMNTTGGSLTLSEASDLGSPKLTYTVPTDVTEQIDLMTAQTNVNATTTPQVDLKFGHALTAVRIVCGKDMLAGTISKVEISGIYGSGTQVVGSNKWVTSGQPTSYTISKDINLPADNTSGDNIHAGNGTSIAGTKTDNLTFMLMPQTLPEGASITIEFTDKASSTKRTITGSIAGQTWEAGKIITYSVSPSSIHINASVEIDKKGITAENPTGDVIPYSGIWYDVKYNPAKVEIVQAGVDTKQIEEIPIEEIRFEYKLENSDEWKACTKKSGGLLQIAPQPAYDKMRTGFNTQSETGSETSPTPLTVNGKTANCYLVDQAGYFSLPLVYGNGNVADPAGAATSLTYYPKHDDGRMPVDGKIAGASDAVLCWQDAPDLIDPASVKVQNGNLVFHIRKQTITQGNALLAVRNSSKEIIWSWHIWVTPYKTNFYADFYTSKPDDNYSYDLAKYNLGWCDRHAHNPSREFSLRAVVDMSAYGGAKETPVELGTFTQDVFKGSDAGDNTYYQWGRKDPMLGGIYNSDTPCYTYNKKGQTPDDVEFTMENKQVFNQYNKDGYNYSFCKNPGDMVAPEGEASKGVTIGYAIQHPYMFITNSTNHDTDGAFNYRNHWHIPYADYTGLPYLNEKTHIMFSAWNSGATDAGYSYTNISTAHLEHNAKVVTKSVYDPCPPEFQMPPIHALRGVWLKMSETTASYVNNAWTITSDRESITFPLTGVRNYALRSNEWKTVNLANYEEFYKISMPAFRILTFVSSATIVKKEDYNAYQVFYFGIDRNTRSNNPGTDNLRKSLDTSSNSYGMSVRPMHYAAGK